MSESVADAPEMTEAEAVVQAQIKAYNSHDLESFLAFYAEAVQIYDGNAVLLRDGREALREEYTKRFARTELNVELLGRGGTSPIGIFASLSARLEKKK